jgi:hypothetical protein
VLCCDGILKMGGALRNSKQLVMLAAVVMLVADTVH